ncbi:hypothetical protein A3K63_00555 [Candidatus Micrarchaeota archaeon RBG_16_49_10]|nr:MAG: hypothetical protein A3K63_00555 [Candidatus Micrarchaeota archaeon RBG_16_49_10]
MEDKEIIDIFIKNGFQLSHEVLEIIKTNPEHFLVEFKKLKPRPFIITKRHLEEISRNVKPSLTVKKLNTNGENTINQLNKSYITHYKKIKEKIIESYSPENLISINNIPEEKKPFSVICMVREKGDKHILAEDSTGDTHIYFEEEKEGENIDVGDVLGFICESDGKKTVLKKTYFPFPKIDRQVKKTSYPLSIGIFYDNFIEQSNINILYTDNEKSKSENIVLVGEDFSPTLYMLDGFEILILPKNPQPKNKILKIVDQLIFWGPGKTQILDLDSPPDLIITSSAEHFHLNYKNTTIVSISGPENYFKIDMNTREILEYKVNLLEAK